MDNKNTRPQPMQKKVLQPLEPKSIVPRKQLMPVRDKTSEKQDE